MTLREFIEFNKQQKLFPEYVALTFTKYDGCYVSELTFDYNVTLGNATMKINEKLLDREINLLVPYNDNSQNCLSVTFKEA